MTSDTLLARAESLVMPLLKMLLSEAGCLGMLDLFACGTCGPFSGFRLKITDPGLLGVYSSISNFKAIAMPEATYQEVAITWLECLRPLGTNYMALPVTDWTDATCPQLMQHSANYCRVL